MRLAAFLVVCFPLAHGACSGNHKSQGVGGGAGTRTAAGGFGGSGQGGSAGSGASAGAAGGSRDGSGGAGSGGVSGAAPRGGDGGSKGGAGGAAGASSGGENEAGASGIGGAVAGTAGAGASGNGGEGGAGNSDNPYGPCDNPNDCPASGSVCDSSLGCQPPCAAETGQCPDLPGAGTATPYCMASRCLIDCGFGKTCPEGMHCNSMLWCTTVP
jgi:hypothetical protein